MNNRKNRAIFIYSLFLSMIFVVLFISVLWVNAQEEYIATQVTFDDGGDPYNIITGTLELFPEHDGYGLAGITEMAGWWTNWAAVNISWSPACTVTAIVFDFRYNNGDVPSNVMGGQADFYNDSEEYVASTNLEDSYTEDVWHSDFSFVPIFFDSQEPLASMQLMIGNSTSPPNPPNPGWYHYLDNVRVYCSGAIPPPPANDCILSNYHFDDGDEGWETIGSPEFVSSTVRLDLNDGISQTQYLEPGTYAIITQAKSEGDTSRLFVEAMKDEEDWFTRWGEESWIGLTWQDTRDDIRVLPGDEGDYFFRFSSNYDGHPDTTLVLDRVCLLWEDWDAIDHPLCYADSQDVLQDFTETGIGIDYAAPLGSGIFAVGPGQIVTVAEIISGSLYIEQNVTAEETGSTYLVRYENVNDVQVLPGQLAVTGQLLGYVGENPEEPYLHFSVYDPVLESYVDPELLFSDAYPSCLSSGLKDCVLVNADFDHPVSGGWVYGGDWIYGNGASTYLEGSNIGAFLPVTTSGYISQSIWLPEMPEPGYYTLIFDARAFDEDAAVEVRVENSVLSTTTTISLTERWDDVFIDISDFADSQILVQFTAVGETADGVMLDNTCIIFSTETEGNPVDFDCDFPPFPEGINPWEWLKWLGAVIEWLWCMLRSWLHKLWLAILSLPETIKEFLIRFWTETIKPALESLFDALGLGWLWDWLEFTAWPWLTDPEYGGLATWIALIIDLLGRFINDPLGTLDALLSALINAVLGFIFSIPAVQTGYDVIMAFAYLIWLLRELIISVATILWQAIVFVVTLAGAAIYALQHPDEIGDIDVSPLAVGIQLAQDAIAATPLIYLEALMVGLLAWSFIMWVIRQFGAQT